MEHSPDRHRSDKKSHKSHSHKYAKESRHHHSKSDHKSHKHHKKDDKKKDSKKDKKHHSRRHHDRDSPSSSSSRDDDYDRKDRHRQNDKRNNDSNIPLCSVVGGKTILIYLACGIFFYFISVYSMLPKNPSLRTTILRKTKNSAFGCVNTNIHPLRPWIPKKPITFSPIYSSQPSMPVGFLRITTRGHFRRTWNNLPCTPNTSMNEWFLISK